jgi:hypothetical protein
MIEKEILARCFRQHKPMRKKLFEKNWKKVLTSDERCDIMYKLSSREGSESTLKIEQSKYELTTLEKFQVVIILDEH